MSEKCRKTIIYIHLGVISTLALSDAISKIRIKFPTLFRGPRKFRKNYRLGCQLLLRNNSFLKFSEPRKGVQKHHLTIGLFFIPVLSELVHTVQ